MDCSIVGFSSISIVFINLAIDGDMGGVHHDNSFHYTLPAPLFHTTPCPVQRQRCYVDAAGCLSVCFGDACCFPSLSIRCEGHAMVRIVCLSFTFITFSNFLPSS